MKIRTARAVPVSLATTFANTLLILSFQRDQEHFGARANATNPFECCDENQCLSQECPPHSTCVDDCTGFTCKCDDGYQTSIDGICVPIDETGTLPDNWNELAEKAFASAYEDPHFHISGRSSSQPDLCFDLDGEPLTAMILLDDPETGLSIEGELFTPQGQGKVYFSSFRLITPFKIFVDINIDGFKYNTHTLRRGKAIPKLSDEQVTTQFGDLIVGKMHKTAHGGRRAIIKIESGPRLEIQFVEKHRNVNIRIIDPSGISRKAGGILGKLIRPGSYQVQKLVENRGLLYFDRKMAGVKFQHHAWNDKCWYVAKRDADNLFGQK